LTFADPRRTIPEAARVLRPGGRLVFSTSHPVRHLSRDRSRDRISPRLRQSYFELGRIESSDSIEFQLPFGAWLDLFADAGFLVERLIEIRPAAGARSSYLRADEARFARRWPLEMIWSLRRHDPR
jgi:SAM-dependent methyltransferase